MLIILLVIIIIIYLFIYYNKKEFYINNITILHLVLYSDDIYFNKMYKITSKYYKQFNNVKTIYYKFSNNIKLDYILNNDILLIKGNETLLPGILNKTIKTFNFFNKYNYNYLVRSNISTIINFKLLINELTNNNIDYGTGLLLYINKSYINIYYGITSNIYANTYYASGTSIILSKKVVNYILLKKKYIDYNVIDDVAIGFFIKKYLPDIKLYEFKDNYLIIDKSNIKNIDTKKIIFYRNRNECRNIDIKNINYIINILLK